MTQPPLPEHSPVKPRWVELIFSAIRLAGTVIVILVKLVFIVIGFFIALIFSITWRR